MSQTKTYKPTTPTRRHTVLIKKPKRRAVPKRLRKTKKSKAGRNTHGRITVRHQGGGVKRHYRVIDFKRDKFDIEGEAKSIEYDPNRSVNIARVLYKDGEERYILAPSGLKVGDKIVSGEKAEAKVGNAMQLRNIPAGLMVHNIELTKGKGGQLVRSAGLAAQIQGGDKGYIQLKMPSGEIRLVHEENMATVGSLGNEEHATVKLGKAGRSRHLGIRPGVRGMVMHRAQHPHGGGEGKGVIGGPAKDIYGHRIGTKTRKNKRTNKFIVKRRTTRRRPNVKSTN